MSSFGSNYVGESMVYGTPMPDRGSYSFNIHLSHATSSSSHHVKFELEQTLRKHKPTWGKLEQIRADLDGKCV